MAMQFRIVAVPSCAGGFMLVIVVAAAAVAGVAHRCRYLSTTYQAAMLIRRQCPMFCRHCNNSTAVSNPAAGTLLAKAPMGATTRAGEQCTSCNLQGQHVLAAAHTSMPAALTPCTIVRHSAPYTGSTRPCISRHTKLLACTAMGCGCLWRSRTAPMTRLHTQQCQHQGLSSGRCHVTICLFDVQVQLILWLRG